MSAAPKYGDFVHVEFDAHVNYINSDGSLDLDMVEFPKRVEYVPASACTVIEKPVTVGVGDIITYADAVKLPSGSAVLCLDNDATYVVDGPIHGPAAGRRLWWGDTAMVGAEQLRVLHIRGGNA